MPHETIRKVNEYVEQRQRLLNRTACRARVQASEVDRIQQAHRDLHLAVKDRNQRMTYFA
jgi:hypothetical protein